MKIRLTDNLPINSKHGMVAGLVLETVPPNPDTAHKYVNAQRWVTVPSTGKAIPLFDGEYEVMPQ